MMGSLLGLFAAGMRVAYKVDKVPFYKHVEEFRLDQPVTMGRRDKKSGQQQALLKRLPDAVEVEIKLEGPDKGDAHGACLRALLCLPGK